jgi:hypothetical protein
MKNPVMKLNKSKCNLSNGVEFTIVHNIKNIEGPINSFAAALDCWLARTKEYTAASFVDYVKSKKEYGRIFLTLEEYEKITELNDRISKIKTPLPKKK